MIELTALKLNVELGGSRLYQQQKHQTPKYTYGNHPTPQSIIQAQQMFGTMNILLIAGIMVFLFSHFAVSL